MSVSAGAMLFWPGGAEAVPPGVACSANPAVGRFITQCVAPDPALVLPGALADCAASCAVFCPLYTFQVDCWCSVDDAVNAPLAASEPLPAFPPHPKPPVPRRVVGVLGPTTETKAAHSLDCNVCADNVVIDRVGGVCPGPVPDRACATVYPLRIEECHTAKVTAGDASRPVIDIKPGAGNVTINGVDVLGGTVGILAQNSGQSSLPGTVLKGIRAEQNRASSATDLTQLFKAQLTLNVSSSFPGWPATRAVDDDLLTSWFSANGDACNVGSCPWFEIEFPQDVTVSELQMFGNREFAEGFDFLAGRFQLLDAEGGTLYDTGVINLPLPDRDVALLISNVAHVRRVRFTGTADEGPFGPDNDPGFSELKVFGAATGAGIEVRGNFNEVSGATAQFNDAGIRVGGNSNLIKSNKAIDNNTHGFLITGDVNDIRGNEARINGEIGFDVTGTDNMLKGNRSNRSAQDGSKENDSCEYSFANSTTQDLSGNRKDTANFVGTIPGSPKRYAEGCYE
jgi:hypothetical protein